VDTKRGSIKHGATGSPEYQIWQGMKERCRNPKATSWKNYGSRGIMVKLKSFEQFLAEVGPRPSSRHSIDRVNNDLHYQPGNLRWATPKEQASNRRRRTHCQRGHELTPSNTLLLKDGSHRCKQCYEEYEHAPERNARRHINRAAQRYIKRFGGIIFLDGIPPLIPHDCLLTRWPATIETAVVLAQKVSEIQGRQHL
jgi:hypothetical protein